MLMTGPKPWRSKQYSIELAGLYQAGDAGAMPCLMLHGWLDNAASMEVLFDLAIGPMLALDLPGHGHSEHYPPDQHAPFLDYVDALLCVLDELGWQQAVLIGHSMGGAISMLFASAFPERVQRLILIDVLGPVSSEPEVYSAELRRGLLARRTLGQKQPPIYPDVDAAVAARLGSFGIERTAAQAIVERGLLKTPKGWVWRTDVRLTTPSPTRLTEAQVLAAIASVECAVLIILADPRTSFLNDDRNARRLAQYRNAFCIHWPGTHHVHWSNSKALVNEMSQWLSTA